MSVNLHILFNSCIHESRFLKESSSIINADIADEVVLVGLWDKGLPIFESIDSKRNIWRIPLVTRSLPRFFPFQVLKYMEWLIRFFVGINRKEINTVHAHSITALIAGVFVKLLKRVPLIYDAHELETESSSQKSGLKKKISKVYEYVMMQFVDELLVVTDSIETWYKKRYPQKKITVIANIPDKFIPIDSKSSVLREKFNIPKDKILYIYQGGMSSGRNIELLLRVFSTNQNSDIVFMGSGPLVANIITSSKKYTNIHYQQPVSIDLIPTYTSCADIGVAIPKNSCLSHYYGLGNKHFEYLLNGLPLLVANYPERARLVDENDCGWKVEPNESDLSYFIKNLTLTELNEKKKNTKRCRYKFHWESEEKKLISIYRRVLS